MRLKALRERLTAFLKPASVSRQLDFSSSENPPAADVETVRRGLVAYNEQFTGPLTRTSVGSFARDSNGTIIAGAHGLIGWDWLYVDLLWVSEEFRGSGVGARVLRELEALALSKGVHRFHLGTATFQALDFYKKQGYEVFAELPGHPPGFTDYSLKKIVDPAMK